MIDTPLEKLALESEPDQPETLRKVLLGRRKEFVEALSEIDAEISEIQTELSQKIDGARNRRQPIEEALTHLDALLRIEGWTESDGKEVGHKTMLNGNGKTAVEAAHDLLSTLRAPLHYRKLAQRLSENGVYLGGKDPAATLLSKMSRDNRFKRSPDRGVYGLASWPMRKGSIGKRKAKPKRARNPRI